MYQFKLIQKQQLATKKYKYPLHVHRSDVFFLLRLTSVGNGLGNDWELSPLKPKVSHSITLGPK